MLGFAIYFAFRSGLVGGSSIVNPHGVVTIGLLGGWFSKTTSDKLKEVFENLLKTDEDDNRNDKLADAFPVIELIQPNPVPGSQTEITIKGKNFEEGTVVLLNNGLLPSADVTFVSESELKVSLANATNLRPGEVSCRVKNPTPPELRIRKQGPEVSGVTMPSWDGSQWYVLSPPGYPARVGRSDYSRRVRCHPLES